MATPLAYRAPRRQSEFPRPGKAPSHEPAQPFATPRPAENSTHAAANRLTHAAQRRRKLTALHSQNQRRPDPAPPAPKLRQVRTAPTAQTTLQPAVAACQARSPPPCANRRLRQQLRHHNALPRDQKPTPKPRKAHRKATARHSPRPPSNHQKRKEARPDKPAAPQPVAKS